jgi:hypothetical protein
VCEVAPTGYCWWWIYGSSPSWYSLVSYTYNPGMFLIPVSTPYHDGLTGLVLDCSEAGSF